MMISGLCLAAAPALAGGETVGDLPMGGKWSRYGSRDPAGAWPYYLRSLPVRPEGSLVLDSAGNPTGMDAWRVVDLPLVPGDLQQCADSVLRLRATYLRNAGGDPAFRYTSGFVSKWSSWSRGDRPKVYGTLVKVSATGKADDSDAAFEAWLADLFTYAGTYSLVRDTEPVAGGPTAVQPGDVVVHPGSPGHAVIVLDTAHDADNTYVLVGQGFMPAQSFHVCRGPYGGWFWASGDTLPTAPISLEWSGLRRFAG